MQGCLYINKYTCAETPEILTGAISVKKNVHKFLVFFKEYKSL